jgi:hypothetical protein
MAGFFEDVGRTGAVRQTVGDLIQAGRAIREEGRAGEQLAIQKGQFDILKAEAGRKQQVFEQQERVAGQVVPLDSLLANVPPSSRKMIEDYGRQNNFIENVGGVDVISNRNLRIAQQQIAENTVFQKQLDEAALVDVNNSMQQIQTQLQDPAVKDKDRQGLMGQMAELQKQQVFVLNSIKTQDAAIRKAVATEEAKRVGVTAKPPTVTQIKGGVLSKALQEGVASLTPEEKLIFEKETSRSGFGISISPDGTINVVSGGKTLPAVQSEKLIGMLDFSNQLTGIESLYDPAFVGFFDNIEAQISELTGIGANEKEIVFRRLVNDISDTILRLRSGAQINEQEYQRMLKLIPELGKSDEAFVGRLKGLKASIRSSIDTRRKAGQETGFQVPSAPAPTLQGQPRFKIIEVK